MTSKDIAHLRLANQSIASSRFTDPTDVVRSLGAVQAQDYGQSLWAIGLRTKGSVIGDVLRAIEEGRIVRTWPMRGTIHFVPAEDAKWMVGLSGERTIRSARARHVGLNLDDKIFARAEALFREALHGGKRLSRPQIKKLLEEKGFDVREQRSGHILWVLSQRGVLCIGPMEDKQQTYALLDEWVPKSRDLEHGEGLGELARRYFTSHGPATLTDFATWSSQPQRDARIGLELAKPDLTSVQIDGAEYWMGRDARTIDPAAVKATYLLAAFEEYLLGYKDRSAVVEPGQAVTTYTNGIFFPIIVSDGQVVGTWKRVVKPKAVAVSFSPFHPLPAAVGRQVRQQAERYGDFMGLPIVFDK